MENQKYEMSQIGSLDSQKPPADSEEKLPIDDQQQPLVNGAASSMGLAADPTMPPPYQSYGGIPGQGLVTELPQQSAVVIPVQPTHEPDYLTYSILTMSFCCLPLGIAALVYSIQTRDANRFGDAVAARQNSRRARNFARSALGVGLVLYIAFIVFFVIIIVRYVNAYSERLREVKLLTGLTAEEDPNFPH